MQASKEMDSIYSNRIDFVYFSFDKDKRKWKTKSRDLGIKNTYLVATNFKSDFARNFDISTIPRYILLDKNGVVINDHLPRPTRKEALKKLLENLL